jgi:hypothetical protein
MRLLICIQSWFSNLGKTFASCIRILLQSTFSNILAIKFNQKEVCLILGNGPSLKQTIDTYPSETLQQFDLMAVNQFADTDYFSVLKPKFYLLNAVTYFQEETALSPLYQNLRKELYKSLSEKITWDMYLIVPFRAKKSSNFKDLLNSNSHIHAVYFNQTPGEGFTFFTHFVFNRAWAMPRPHNVLIPGIMHAIHLNYKRIAIVGADHSWLGEISVNNNNEALVHQKHYYDEQTSRPEKVQDYITRPRKLHEILHKFYLSFKGYWDIDTYSKKRNVNIYNCSEVSMIDAFERKSLSELRKSQS